MHLCTYEYTVPGTWTMNNQSFRTQGSKTQRPESSTMWRFILECREGSRSRLYREDSLADAFSDTASVLDLDLIGCCARLRRWLRRLPTPLRNCLLCCCHCCLHDPCATLFLVSVLLFLRSPCLTTPHNRIASPPLIQPNIYSFFWPLSRDTFCPILLNIVLLARKVMLADILHILHYSTCVSIVVCWWVFWPDVFEVQLANLTKGEYIPNLVHYKTIMILRLNESTPYGY